MIISKTPFRISFFGGGTDYPVWFRENKGAVLATSIDKYCYISLRYLPPFFDYNHRIVYSKVEHVKKISEIDHPAVKGALSYMGIKNGIEIHHDGDLPARAGLGTSSSFTVGLLNALYALKGKNITKKDLAREAIHVEQKLLKENVGSQDQITAAFGGFNKIEFNGDDNFKIQPVIINKKKYNNLQGHMMLFFTGFSRIASNIAGEQIKKTPDRKKELKTMYNMVDRAVNILSGSDSDLSDFGKLLHETWMIKRKLTSKITTPLVDEIYEKAKKAGAIGGKLLGAGGGGFILFFVEPEKQVAVKTKLKGMLHVPIRFEDSGSQIIYYTKGEEEN